MKKRYIVYAFVIILLVQPLFLPPVLPVIQLPGEVLFAWPGGKEFLGGLFGKGFTNTFLATIVAFFIILFMTLRLNAKSRTADEVPSGFYNFFEMIIELAYNYVQGVAGKNTKKFFPFFMTFILWIVIGNWLELVPFVDSIGIWEDKAHFNALKVEEAAKDGLNDGLSPFAVLAATPLTDEHKEKIAEEFGIVDESVVLAGEVKEEFLHEIEHLAEEEFAEENLGNLRNGLALMRAPVDENGEKPDRADWTIVPFLRAPGTDLNFTIGLALISVIMTQIYGMQAQGMKYWNKFFTWDGDKIKKNPLAIMDTGVGLLEFISEIFKIVSFAFRLLGNIFAGQILLFVIASLLPVANLVFWHLEFAIILLQGAVFALLTLTFMQGATESHHGDEAHH